MSPDEQTESDEDSDATISSDGEEASEGETHRRELETAADVFKDAPDQMKALLDFYESIIFQGVRGDVFKSVILHFLAVLGIDEEISWLRQANDFSYMLASVVYCMRVLAVEIILLSTGREDQNKEDDRRFRQVRGEYLADGSYSVMSKMLSMLAYGKHLAMNHSNSGAVSWSEDRLILSYQGKLIARSRFKSMVHRAVAEAEDMLWKDLLCIGLDNRFDILLGELQDDMTWTKRGVSFIDNTHNGLQEKRKWTLKRILSDKDSSKMRNQRSWAMPHVRSEGYGNDDTMIQEWVLTRLQHLRDTQTDGLRHTLSQVAVADRQAEGHPALLAVATISISREVIGEQFARGYTEETTEVEEAEVEDDDALEISASRGAEIGVNCYRVSVDIVKHLSSRSIDTFRLLSWQWHEFLELASYGRKGQKRGVDARRMSGLTTPPTIAQLEASPLLYRLTALFSSQEIQGSRAVGEEEIKKAMRKVLGCEEVAFWSKEQREALQVIVSSEQRTPLVVVLPTGGGKSLLFMAPACLDNPGVTIVVVPYRALVNNLVITARTARIDCIEYKPREQNLAALVFVSADFVAEGQFLSYAQLLSAKGILQRVFVDESHLTFTASD
ncbi:hypothetical protein Q7P35_000825 [Cladosporium inversicolor]